uniref:Odorant receptor 49 n=1 Tax=Eucryptorrhynchus brandti TaxID=436910 RepID=A0A8F2JGG5_EUCBR|nr:odorant receptor 49 [Eucryptorrhynchus brandti]
MRFSVGMQIFFLGQNLNDSLFSLQCLLVVTGQLLVLVWHADVINVESVNVASALYEFPWYEKGVEIQKMAHIMTIRAQRPLRLTIGPFKPLTNQITSQFQSLRKKDPIHSKLSFQMVY